MYNVYIYIFAIYIYNCVCLDVYIHAVGLCSLHFQAAEELGRLLDDPALARVPFVVLGGKPSMQIRILRRI